MKTISITDLLALSGFAGSTRPYFAWQIDLTTRCPLRCRMCVKEGAAARQGSDMRLEDFRSISHHFRKTETVVLQGWGEPMLYGNLAEAISIVKETGARVGFVTCGSIADTKFMSELIDAGTDFIGFSLAGATAKTHNAIRLGSDFEVLLRNIRAFREAIKKRDRNTPRLHIVYLMLKDNMAEVPVLVDLARTEGIPDLILTNLIHINSAWQEGQRVFSCTDPPAEEFSALLRLAASRAVESNIRLFSPSLLPADVAVCQENPLKNIYISPEGEVAPCVYLSPPLPSPFTRIYCGSHHKIEKTVFGNIFRQPFEEIWNHRDYAAFRSCFDRRVKRDKKIPWHDPETGPPAPCRTCHKMLGV